MSAAAVVAVEAGIAMDLEGIVAGTAFEDVVTAPTVDGVVAFATDQMIAAVGTG